MLRSLLAIVLLAAAPGLAPGASQDVSSRPPPNIILIVADDLGWADLGAYGHTVHRTPSLDRLAARGMRFTNAYAAAPVCSPTRAALMTGKPPARLHLTDWLPGRPDRPDQPLKRPPIVSALPLEEVTIAEALHAAGYVTAHIGKWHLGGEGFGPEAQGFTINVAGDHTGTPLSYFAPFSRNDRIMPGLEEAPQGEYLTDRLTDEAVRFIEKNRERPFFLYLAHYAVHIPMRAKARMVEQYWERGAVNAVYAAMVESVDQSVGRVVARLDTLGLADDTLVLFTSDNGGLHAVEGANTPATSNSPLRNGKGYLHEGGIRVPLIAAWPGRIEAGATESTPVISMDLFQTLLDAAHVHSPHRLDGMSLLPLLTGRGGLTPRRLYWHYPHYSNQGRAPGAPPGGGPGAAIRDGRWKLIEHFETGSLELYDLDADPGESRNLAASEPGRADMLREALHAWQQAVGAQFMTNEE